LKKQNYQCEVTFYSRIFFLFILLVQILSFNASAVEICQTQYTLPTDYLKVQAAIDQKIGEFSNLPAFAKKADALLSKLITAKSPVIITWINKRNLQTKSEEEVIREWRKYFALNFIIAKYPYKETELDLPIEFLFGTINKLFLQDGLQQKMESLFKKTQTNAMELIKAYKFEKTLESQINTRIQNIKIYWAGALKDSKFKNQPLEFLDWGIAYDPVNNEINMGVHALAYPNEETFLAVFSHEIAHSFDSCRWGAYFVGNWPFEKIAKCLRSSDSAGAKPRDDTKLPALITEGKITNELAEALKLNPTCNKREYPPLGTQADQLPETFADWYSAEAMAQMHLPVTANIRTDLCADKTLNDGSSYLGNRDRLEKIYFANPKLNPYLNLNSSVKNDSPDAKRGLPNSKINSLVKFCKF
jgi:hypothetical protein